MVSRRIVKMYKRYICLVLSVVLTLSPTIAVSAEQIGMDVVRTDSEENYDDGSSSVLSKNTLDPALEVEEGPDGEMSYGYIPIDRENNVPVVEYVDGMDPVCGAPEYYGCDSSGKIQIPSYVPELRNQNPYGTCWAHASIALAEIYMKKHGIEISPNYSELHLAYFQYHSEADPLGGTIGDSNVINSSSSFMSVGGNVSFAENILASWQGAASEAKVPYSSAKTALSSGLSPSLAYEDDAHLTDYYEVNIKENPEIVKALIQENGAVAISYCDSGAYYSSKYNSYYCDTAYTTNHAVSVVGWNDNYPASNFATTAEDNGAWLIRNSWTTGYSESHYGYFWMSYYDKSLAEAAYAFTFDNEDNFDNIYEYDGASGTMDYYASSSLKAANVFETSANGDGENLEAVSFYSGYTNVDYTVSIYLNPDDDSDPESGILISDATTSGEAVYAGYHTVRLNKPVELSYGDTYSVVISLSSKTGEGVSIGYEYGMTLNNWMTIKASSDVCQSYIKIYNSWRDFGASKRGNLKIKAFTSNTEGNSGALNNEITDFSLDVDSSGLVLVSGEGKTVNVSYLPVDGAHRRIKWTSADTKVASVTASGYVAAVGSGQTTITASYTRNDGTVISHSFDVSVIGIEVTGPTTLYEDEYGQYSYTITPASYDREDATWESSNPAILEIERTTGKATAKRSGTSTITLTVGEYTKKFSVSVTAKEIIYDNISPVVKVKEDATIEISWDRKPGASSYQIGVGIASGMDDADWSNTIEEDGSDSYTYTYSGFYGQSNLPDRVWIYARTVFETANKRTTVTSGSTYRMGKAHKINYVLNGGELQEGAPSYYIEGSSTSLYDAVKPYNTFGGWYESQNFSTTRIYNIPSTAKKEYTLYAKWTPHKYKIQYNPNGGVGTKKTQNANMGEEITFLGETTFVRDGYILTGWSEDSDGLGTIYRVNEKREVQFDVANNGTVDLYAVWEPHRYTVIFDYQTGTEDNEVESLSVIYGSTYGVLPSPEREGYTFEGWYTQPEGGDLVTSGTFVTTKKDHVLYAQWSKVYDRYTEPVVCTPGNLETALEIEPGSRIRLSSATENAEIYYNINSDQNPTSDTTTDVSYRYTEPIVITSDMADIEGKIVIKTIATKKTFKNGPISSYTFTLKDVSEEYGDVLAEDLQALPGETLAQKVANIPNTFWASKIEDVEYMAKAIKPDIRVYYGKRLLENKKDYTLTYKNNVNPGVATVTATGKGNYAGSYVAQFNIIKRDISYEASTIGDISVAYNANKAQLPSISLTVDGKKLTRNKNYTLILTDELDNDYTTPVKEPGTYSVSVNGIGNYCGEGGFSFRILEAQQLPMNTLKVKIANKEYNDGSPVTLEPEDIAFYKGSKKLELEYGEDYTILPDAYLNNSDIGKAKVVITGVGDTYIGSLDATFNITGKALKANNTVIEGIEKSYTYTGKAIEPAGAATGTDAGTVTVSYVAGKGEEPQALNKGVDYTVSYITDTAKKGNNLKAGTATIIFTGKGAYTGTIKKTFRINSYDMSIDADGAKKLSVNMLNSDGTVNADKTYYYIKGGVSPDVIIQFSLDGSDEKETLIKGKDYTLSYANNKKIGNAQDTNKNDMPIGPSLVIKGKGNYKGAYLRVFYTILPQDIGRMDISASDKAAVAKINSYSVKPVIADIFNAKKAKLVQGTDYENALEYTYAYDTEIKKYNPVTKKINSYTDLVTAGTIIDPKTDVLLPETIVRVTATGKNNYTGTISKTYRICGYDISKATIKVANQTFLGVPSEPGKSEITATIKIGKDTIKLEPYDYEIVSYSNNSKVGTGSVVLHGCGKYGGYKTVKYNIVKKSMYYVIVFKPNGATSGTMKNQSFNVTGKALSAVAYKRPGYLFQGWTTSADSSTPEYENKQVITDITPGEILTLYAVWKEIHYTIRFDINKPSGMELEDISFEPIECVGNQKYKLPAQCGNPKWYTFVGWNTQRDGKGKSYGKGATVSCLATKENQVVTLYAVWKADGDKSKYDLMIALKSKYPEGMRWTNDNYYDWNGGIYWRGYGCAGFAFLLSDAAFGSAPAYIHYDKSRVRVGDILRLNGNSHSVIVLEVHDSYVVVAEGNYNSSIHWGREIPKSEICSRPGDYIMSRW